ncbi:bifunctional diaminohydroxyphosphoribosylaminopyrimidine deaminase/5-amino-6-(5-phosphoribosylamino)uracil reductase RibD [Shouchella shacheensis]|uniref:bifunctional diaminohydroxyphosphoribosylaminopyrimidine deaminase/5-amino-6-(5-phosphoribosylamino)uracil reductase RibD n=1 Tax=Shouchella shacheensis TaxID=1649580 RepID=UPI000740269A|nr:bifunctional diaminohydroxyphosphoribosylaminopyrimidine deaminase/5-amino-6-(5-phosphoribosylamino)uracil reductase RibD [Shouchella shacheensis]
MNDRWYMEQALQHAAAMRGQTSPNPMVGAVIVKDGRIVGTGAHLKAGTAHAEVHALRMAGADAKGATMYVTLEPCSHYGKTPPCADAIVDAELARVVVATTDPNPKVAGAGIAKIERAGILVELGVCKKEAAKLNEAFFHFVETKRPYVTLKTASTLDGKTATISGESQWITGNAAREDVHESRHLHDAILVGIGTVLADHPSLTTRLPQGGRNPVRVVLDRRLRLPEDAKLVTDQEAETWVFTEASADSEKARVLGSKNVRVVPLEQLTIEAVLAELGRADIMTLYVEGGATVSGAFVEADAVDRYIAYTAPKLVGGSAAPTTVGGSGIASLNEARQFEVEDVRMVGADVRLIARRKREEH